MDSIVIGMKDFYIKDEWYGRIFTCPNCKLDRVWRAFNFCPMCGEKLEWLPDVPCQVCNKVHEKTYGDGEWCENCVPY